MADEREIFTILEDNTTGAGVKNPARAEGDAAGGNHQPSVIAKDLAGDYTLVPVRSVGDADSDGVPGFAFKDSSGNLVRPQLNSDGTLAVSSEAPGTKKNAHATVTGVVATATDVAAITLTVLKGVDNIEAIGACTKATLWDIVWDNNGAETILAQFITGAGQFSFIASLKNVEFTAGAAGTQELKIVGTQLKGPASDLHGTIAAIELA